MAATERRGVADDNPAVGFMRLLVDAHPVLRPFLEEHLEDMEGELLPHLLMHDVYVWVVARPPSDPEAAAVVASLDAGLAPPWSDDPEARVENVITVSFLEFWPEPPEPAGAWRTAFPPRLTAVLAELEHA